MTRNNGFPFQGGNWYTWVMKPTLYSMLPTALIFDIAAEIHLMPTAARAYIADDFDSDGDGRDISWGLCHFTNGYFSQGLTNEQLKAGIDPN